MLDQPQDVIRPGQGWIEQACKIHPGDLVRVRADEPPVHVLTVDLDTPTGHDERHETGTVRIVLADGRVVHRRWVQGIWLLAPGLG